MSAQSVIHNSDSKIAIQINKYLKDAGVDYILFKRFSVGKKPDAKSINLLLKLHTIFCNDVCMISEEDKRLVKEIINRELIFSNPSL